jgi:hypothetical protein
MPRSTLNSAGLVPAPEARPDGYFIHDNDTVVDIVDVTTRTRSITFTVFDPPRYKERSKNNYEARSESLHDASCEREPKEVQGLAR